ncbi:MAG TPA: CPBP family intramembrane metalloprotease [Anaerolineae bacterium]|nr:CPBP family intramembrane metalloprotease [Anaerolineae bacterium]
MVLLFYLPFIAMVVLANYGEGRRWARFLTYGLLILLNLLIGLVGLLFFLVQWAAGLPGVQMPPELEALNFLALGLASLGTAIVAFLPLLPPLRRWLARLIPIVPASCVHATALVFAIYLIGGSLATLWTIRFVVEAPEGVSLTPSLFWQQGLAFTLLGLAGVGIFLRRDLRGALDRLKLRGVPLPHWGLAAGATLLLLAFVWVVSFGWSRLWPQSYEEVERISELLFGEFLSPLGALTLGLSAGIGEELLFRGALQPRFGLILTTLLFTVAHTQYTVSPALLEIFVVGLVLGLLRDRASTTVCILVHAAYNALNVLLAPYFP